MNCEKHRWELGLNYCGRWEPVQIYNVNRSLSEL